MLFLIVTITFSALCVVFDCYHGDYRTLCSFSLLRLCLAHSVLFLLVTTIIIALSSVFDCCHNNYSALCLVFVCYNNDYGALCSFLLFL